LPQTGNGYSMPWGLTRSCHREDIYDIIHDINPDRFLQNPDGWDDGTQHVWQRLYYEQFLKGEFDMEKKYNANRLFYWALLTYGRT